MVEAMAMVVGVKPSTHAKKARYLTNHIFLMLSPREVTTSRWRKKLKGGHDSIRCVTS
jgi:hypothetical protein